MTTEQLTIEEASKALREARERHDIVKAEADAASRRECDARNALNQAQRDFDAAVEAVRANPPLDTNWHRRARKGDALCGDGT
ncbi:hypothetical protein [Sphingomonas sp.]|jgi:hypothetical protein|uniref:hypothetical protein n=1 Tax=Sphingomonas sp. TaxID=28214 RepID=UPI0035630D31